MRAKLRYTHESDGDEIGVRVRDGAVEYWIWEGEQLPPVPDPGRLDTDDQVTGFVRRQVEHPPPGWTVEDHQGAFVYQATWVTRPLLWSSLGMLLVTGILWAIMFGQGQLHARTSTTSSTQSWTCDSETAICQAGSLSGVICMALMLSLLGALAWRERTRAWKPFPFA